MQREPDEQQTPLPLEYYARQEPLRRRARQLTAWSLVLLAGWLPYVCGIVNAAAVVRSYSPDVLSAHRSGSLLFMGIGLALSLASLIGFLRLRHLPGTLAAAIVLLVQLMIAGCIGALGNR